MRRFILPLVSLVAVIGFAVHAEAQAWRRPMRPSVGFNPITYNTFTTFQTPRGTFAPSVPGIYNPTTGAFMPSATGASVLTSRGVFVPQSGTFVPTTHGNFMLTNREVFNPNTGRFTPSARGNYVFSTPGNLVNTSGANVPVRFGGLGLLNPLNPFSAANPVNQAHAALLANYNAALTASYLTAMNPYGFVNPYAPYLTGYNPAYASPYMAAAYGMGPYGYTSAAYSSPYGNGNYYSPMYAPSPYVYGGAAPQGYANVPAYTGDNTQNNQRQITLTAIGVPNENGKVHWPLAFRLLPAGQKRELLDKLEADLQVLAQQGAAGNVSPTILSEAKESVEILQRWLVNQRPDLAEDAYREGDMFLRRLERTLRRLS